MLHFKPLGQQTTLGLTSLLGDRFPLGQWHPLGSELQTALGQWHPLGSQFQNTSIEAFDSTLSQSWHDREFVQSESPEVRGTSRQYSRVSSPKTSLELDVLPLEKISSIEPLQSIRSIVSPSVRETVNSKIPSSSTSSLRIPQRTAAPLQFLSPERVSAREQDVEPRSLQRFEPQDRESIDPNLSFSELQSKIQLKHSPGDTSKPQNTETTTPSIQERATILDSEADVSESLDRSSSLRSSEISERVLPLQTQLESEDITTIPPETGEKEDEPSPIQKQIQRQSEFLDRDLDRTDSESSSILESPSPENSDIETISTEIAEAVEPDETALSIQPQPSIPPSESNFSDRSISPTPPERPELTISPQEQLESEDITTIPPETGEKQTEPSPTQKQIQRQPELPIRDLERVESRSPGVPSPPTPRNLETEPSISPTLDRKDRDIQASPELKPGIPQPSADTIETQQDAEARVTEIDRTSLSSIQPRSKFVQLQEDAGEVSEAETSITPTEPDRELRLDRIEGGERSSEPKIDLMRSPQAPNGEDPQNELLASTQLDRESLNSQLKPSSDRRTFKFTEVETNLESSKLPSIQRKKDNELLDTGEDKKSSFQISPSIEYDFDRTPESKSDDTPTEVREQIPQSEIDNVIDSQIIPKTNSPSIQPQIISKKSETSSPRIQPRSKPQNLVSQKRQSLEGDSVPKLPQQEPSPTPIDREQSETSDPSVLESLSSSNSTPIDELNIAPVQNIQNLTSTNSPIGSASSQSLIQLNPLSPYLDRYLKDEHLNRLESTRSRVSNGLNLEDSEVSQIMAEIPSGWNTISDLIEERSSKITNLGRDLGSTVSDLIDNRNPNIANIAENLANPIDWDETRRSFSNVGDRLVSNTILHDDVMTSLFQDKIEIDDARLSIIARQVYLLIRQHALEGREYCDRIPDRTHPWSDTISQAVKGKSKMQASQNRQSGLEPSISIDRVSRTLYSLVREIHHLLYTRLEVLRERTRF